MQEAFLELAGKAKSFTEAFEPWWTIILVPIWQEIVFRYLPYQFLYSSGQNFWLVGITSSLVFALIHWYFGWVFVIAAFVAGMAYWYAMVHYGLLGAIILHALVNIVDLVFGIRHYLADMMK